MFVNGYVIFQYFLDMLRILVILEELDCYSPRRKGEFETESFGAEFSVSYLIYLWIQLKRSWIFIVSSLERVSQIRDPPSSGKKSCCTVMNEGLVSTFPNGRLTRISLVLLCFADTWYLCR